MPSLRMYTTPPLPCHPTPDVVSMRLTVDSWPRGPALVPAGAYAGIGSRETPPDVLDLMGRFAERLAALGWTMRSGGADGSDTAFRNGAMAQSGAAHVKTYIPWEGFNGLRSDTHLDVSVPKGDVADRARDIAQRYHPAWFRLSQGARKLMARNTLQVLGDDLASPSDFVMCWTPGGRGGGGTGQAIRIAKDMGIPVWDLGDPAIEATIRGWMEDTPQT